jgi:hypothetical protein
MEKHGVVRGEGEQPKPESTKTANEKEPCRTNCCNQLACGNDPLSKMAEEAASGKADNEK